VYLTTPSPCTLAQDDTDSSEKESTPRAAPGSLELLPSYPDSWDPCWALSVISMSKVSGSPLTKKAAVRRSPWPFPSCECCGKA
jgi:hypothetical protein